MKSKTHACLIGCILSCKQARYWLWTLS